MLHVVTKPLFSRYLFIQFNPAAESWSPIRATPGVRDIVRSGPHVHMASDAAVDALQASEQIRATPLPGASLWRPGDPCRLAHGPFQKADAVVIQITPPGHAIVAILMLGQLRTLAIPLDRLEPRD